MKDALSPSGLRGGAGVPGERVPPKADSFPCGPRHVLELPANVKHSALKQYNDGTAEVGRTLELSIAFQIFTTQSLL